MNRSMRFEAAGECREHRAAFSRGGLLGKHRVYNQSKLLYQT